MHEPAFWNRPSSLLSRLLMPLGALYGAIAARRLLRTGMSAGVPVICVGNYTLGGAGKTPTVLALAELLRALGETPVVLSRGYGGRLRGPLRVDPHRHTAADVGDEPLMMAGTEPVIVARRREAGIAPARALGASVILLDDGFQNPAIAKDLSLIVIDGDRGLGNGQVFPAGPLRAPLPPQLARTDALVVVGNGTAADEIAASIRVAGGVVLRAQLIPDETSVEALRGRRVYGFAGIGDPARFFRSLRACGIDVAAERAFPDHHPFSPAEIAELQAAADRDDLTLVTTEKDLARLRSSEQFAAVAQAVVPFAVKLAFDDEPKLRSFLTGRIGVARQKHLSAPTGASSR
jgi:tetraacyldisaccharide 4'-kinase